MSTIFVDEDTETALREQAAARGMPVDRYIKVLADHSNRLLGSAPQSFCDLSIAEFRKWLEEISIELPVESTLPADFSRADIYNDHDW